LYRLRGSLSFAAAARTVLLISADPDHPDRRVLSAVKMAYGPLPPPLAFRIASSATTPHDIRLCENRPRDNRSCKDRSCENPFSHADPAPESDHLPPLGPSVPAPQSVIHNSPPLPRPSGNAPTSSTCRRKPIPPSPRPAPGSPTTSPPAPAPPATSSATPTPPASRTAHSSAPNNSSASAPSAPSTTASGAGTRPAPQHQSPSGSACHYPHLGAPSRPRRAP
jgi:hypothetical protein